METTILIRTWVFHWVSRAEVLRVGSCQGFHVPAAWKADRQAFEFCRLAGGVGIRGHRAPLC